ncbi:hypothetical protein IEQ34_021488 [Dendrobium chrysotoxum]|uniref:Uncharacterized protein n=1 Tax=Dendrobium chrysotoxum TaxID=161865 RepID=A0AAV7G330_DENCH|nr:hypothetical protein IEQ34_021488 [Dendrobium chrysotoxum]
MSNISKHLGLTGNVASRNSPEKWINFQSEVGSQTVTKVPLLSFGPSNVWDFRLEGRKRKRKDIDGDTVSGRDPLVPVLQCSSNPPESSTKNSSTLSMVFSPYVADEEFSVNQDLNLQLKLDIEDAHIPKKARAFVPLHNLVSKPSVNLELNLSVGSAISAITSEVGTPAPGFYMAYGGGHRCENADCQNGAEGKTMRFQSHGGGRHCEQLDCIKNSEGRSKFCIAHDGGRRCREVGCTTVSRGKSGLYIKYGGGRSFIMEESTKGATSGFRCDRLSSGKVGLCAAHSALVQDLRIRGGETMSNPTSQKPAAPAKTDQMKMIAVDDSCLFSSNDLNQRMHTIIPAKPGGVSLTEGRIHGGSLMAFLAKGVPLNQYENQAEECSTSKQDSSHTMDHGCF